MEWFETRHIGNETWAIDDHGCDVMYLIRGKEKCLLIDTGWGVGDLQTLPLSKGILDELVTGIESILAGKLVGQKEKTSTSNWLRCDFDACGIAYRPDRL